MNSVCVSVIIPVYNTAQWVNDCLNSVIHQDHQNLQIICINDGSTDESQQILDRFSRQDDRIQVFSQNNRGLSAARNTGIENASGKYILFLDSDDMIKAHLISELVQRAERDSLDMLCFDFEPYFEINSLKKSHAFLNKHHRYDYPGICPGCELFTGMQKQDDFFPMAWLGFYNREWLFENRISFLDGILHEDEFFSFSCYLYGKRAGYISLPGYVYRLRPDSIMTKPICIDNIISKYISSEKMLSLCYENRNLLEQYPAFFAYALHMKHSAAYDFQQNEQVISSQAKGYFEKMILDDLKGYGAKEELDAVYNSASWRLGNKLVRPFHFLKDIMKK